MKILIIRYKQMGDAIIAMAVCRSLKKTYPDAHIHFAVYEQFASLFENQYGVDKVIPISTKHRGNVASFITLCRHIRAQRYDMVFDLMNSNHSLTLTLLSASKHKAGLDYSTRLRTKLYPHAVYQKGNTSLDRKLSILKSIDGEVHTDDNLQLDFDAQEIENQKQRLQSVGIDLSRPLVMLAFSSRRLYKCWPEHYMLDIAKYLIEKHQAQLYLIAAPNEAMLLDDFYNKLSNKMLSSHSIFTTPATNTARELASLMHHGDLFVGNEGGARHLASAIDLPSLAICSPPVSKRHWIKGYPDQGEDETQLKHQAVDLSDVFAPYEMPDNDTLNDKRGAYYELLTPELIKARIDNMWRLFVHK